MERVYRGRNTLCCVRIPVFFCHLFSASQGLKMPDLQTALSTAIKNQVLATTISEWDNEEKQIAQTQTNTPPAPTLTGNLSKDIFTYIKENPGCNRATVYKLFSKAGANSNSVGSLITQILRNKLAVSDNLSNLTAVRVHYKPLVSGKKKKQLYQ